MLTNIKSQYFVKIIFSFMKNKRKLSLIKLNRNLQSHLDINITDYKLFSGKYITYETKEKINIYKAINNRKLFSGEYFKGKGIEYDDAIIYEGEYLNGKRNGKGKEKDLMGKKLFEGEYLKGKRWNVKEFDQKGNKIYELINGNGFIKEYDEYRNLVFEGEYLNGERNGKGKEYDINGKVIFEGEYLNNKRWKGKGINKDNTVIYDLKNGKGFFKQYNSINHLILEVEYLNGEKNGKGKEYHPNGKLRFEGEYFDNEKNGEGKEYYSSGKLMFEGKYLYNYKRQGKEYINNTLEFEGEYLYNKKWNGIGYDKNGNKIYELINGNGTVKEYDCHGIIQYEGEYKNGKRNGKGKLYDINGELLYEGKFENGRKKNKKIK